MAGDWKVAGSKRGSNLRNRNLAGGSGGADLSGRRAVYGREG